MHLLSLLLLLAASRPALAADAEDLLRAGQLDAAVEAAVEEANARPDDLDAQELLIDLFLSLGLPSTARAWAQTRIDVSPSDAVGWYLLGRAEQDPSEARAAYQRALSIDASHARSYMGLAAVQRALGDLDNADSLYRLALQHDDGLAEAWSGLRAVLLARGDRASALDVTRFGVGRAPNDPDAWLFLARAEPDRAADTLQRGIAAVPGDPRLHAALADTTLRSGRVVEAAAAARRALDIDPRQADAARVAMYASAISSGALDVAGFVSLEAARGGSRAADVDSLVVAYPRSALPLLVRADLRARDGDVSGAEVDLRRAVGLEGRGVEAKAALGLLLLGSNRAGEARPLLLAASAARPADASLSVAAARAEARSGEVSAAKLRLRQAREAHPHDPRVVLVEAEVLSLAGDRQGAYDLLVEALPTHPSSLVELGLALAAAARDLGRYTEAAEILDSLAERTGVERLGTLAESLREGR